MSRGAEHVGPIARRVVESLKRLACRRVARDELYRAIQDWLQAARVQTAFAIRFPFDEEREARAAADYYAARDRVRALLDRMVRGGLDE